MKYRVKIDEVIHTATGFTWDVFGAKNFAEQVFEAKNVAEIREQVETLKKGIDADAMVFISPLRGERKVRGFDKLRDDMEFRKIRKGG